LAIRIFSNIVADLSLPWPGRPGRHTCAARAVPRRDVVASSRTLPDPRAARLDAAQSRMRRAASR